MAKLSIAVTVAKEVLTLVIVPGVTAYAHLSGWDVPAINDCKGLFRVEEEC